MRCEENKLFTHARNRNVEPSICSDAMENIIRITKIIVRTICPI